MPALVLFNHRTLLAGDDLRIYAGVGQCLRVAQIGMAFALLSLTEKEFELYENADPNQRQGCLEDSQEWALVVTIFTYLMCSVVVAIITGVIERLICTIAGQGSPTEPEKRSRLRSLCQTNLTVMMVVRMLMMGVGIYVLRKTRSFCECAKQQVCDKPVYDVFLVLIHTHGVDIVFNLLAVFYFGCKCLPNLPRSMESETKWRLCCRFCCTCSSILTCCLVGGKEAIVGDFTDIAMLLSDFFDFHGTLDIVMSDLVAGLLMVKRVQQERIEDCSKRVLEHAKQLRTRAESDVEDHHSLDGVANEVNSQNTVRGVVYRLKRHEGSQCYWEATVTNLLTPAEDVDILAIGEGARFMRLSLSIYTWMMYSFNRPCSGLCELSFLSCQQICSGIKQYPGDTKFCRLHSAAFMREAGLEETEVASAQFQYGIVECPYAIVIDHDWKSVVIVIRGTLSLEDMLKDLTARPTSLDKLGEKHGFDGTNRYAHAGILLSSEWILKDIEEKGVLRDLLDDADSKLSSYRLRITGHSLGAGCAALLAIMLKPRYPDLLCHCFSPPGCTLSKNAAIESEDYLTSYILDTDLIPRASLTGLENLRYDIVEMISRIKVPKAEVVFGYRRKHGYKDMKTINSMVLHDDEHIPDTDFKKEWKRFHQLYKERKIERQEESNIPDVELFPPGKLVHLFKATSDAEPRSWSKGPSFKSRKKDYVARWADRLDFREIRISGTCIDDHSSQNVLDRLEDEAKRMKLSPPYLPPDSVKRNASKRSTGELKETTLT